MVATSCDLNALRCTTKVPQVRLHGSGGGVFVDHRPPGTPVIPWYLNKISRQRSFTSVQTFHTHTPCSRQGEVLKTRWRWWWKQGWEWDEHEDEMEKYLTGAQGGERKSRGREQTPTPTHLAGAGKPWKGKRKEKRRPTETEQNQRKGGRQKRLNQPTAAKPRTSARAGPNLPKKGGTHEIGDRTGN